MNELWPNYEIQNDKYLKTREFSGCVSPSVYLCVCFFSTSRHVLSYHEEAGEAAVQPHLPAGLVTTTQHFPSASSPGPNRCRTQWWVAVHANHSVSGQIWSPHRRFLSLNIHVDTEFSQADQWWSLYLNSPSSRLNLFFPSVCFSCSYIDEEPPSTLAAAVLGFGYPTPSAIALLFAHHHPLPTPPQPCWSPQELRTVIWPVQPTEQPGLCLFFCLWMSHVVIQTVCGWFGMTFMASSCSLLSCLGLLPSDLQRWNKINYSKHLL